MKRFLMFFLVLSVSILTLFNVEVNAAVSGSTSSKGIIEYENQEYKYFDLSLQENIIPNKEYFTKFTRSGKTYSDNWLNVGIYNHELFSIHDPGGFYIFDISWFFGELVRQMTSGSGYSLMLKQDKNNTGFNIDITNLNTVHGLITTSVDFNVIASLPTSNDILYRLENEWYSAQEQNVTAVKIGFRLIFVGDIEIASTYLDSANWNYEVYYNFISGNTVLSGSSKLYTYLGEQDNTPLGVMYKNVESENYQMGYNAGYDSGYYVGHSAGYNAGFTDGTGGSGSAWGMIWSSFLSVFSILSITVFPGVTLGMFAMIPLVFGLLAFILNLGKKD